MTSVRITFLGTGAGNCIHRAHTAIVLDWSDGPRILIDASSGNSVLRNSALMGMMGSDFSKILVSHHHSDHIGGLPHIQGQRFLLNPDGDPLEIYCSLEAAQGVRGLFDATSITHSTTEECLVSRAGATLARWHPVQDQDAIDLGSGVWASSFPVDHINGAIGWRIEKDDLTVVFSGDTRFSTEVARAAENADMLIHEALSTETDKESTHNRAHSTAAEAATVAHMAKAKQLVMTHIDTGYHANTDLLVKEAEEYYQGHISVAHDLFRINVAS